MALPLHLTAKPYHPKTVFDLKWDENRSVERFWRV